MDAGTVLNKKASTAIHLFFEHKSHQSGSKAVCYLRRTEYCPILYDKHSTLQKQQGCQELLVLKQLETGLETPKTQAAAVF